MMNVETVLSNTSESDVGGSNSNVRLYSSNPQSARQPRASKRVSQDPPGDTVTPMEAAFLELVPQDVVAMDDAEDYQSTQSTLTNPPTISFLNQPTDEDWEREHSDPYSSNLNRDSYDANRNENRRNQHDRPSNSRPSNTQSRSSNAKPSQKVRGYDSDESSSLPEAPGTKDEEDDTDDDDVLNFLKRTYTPADESLLFSDHVMDDIIEEEEDERQSYQQQPKGRASLDEGVHRNKSSHPPPPNRDEMQRISSKKSMASTIDTTTAQKKHPRHRQRPRQSSKVAEEDDVDSDLTPVMKSPRHSKASFQPKQQKDKQASKTSSLRSAPFQSPVSKKKTPTGKKAKIAPSKSKSTSKQAKADHSKSKRSVRPDKTKEATASNAKATATPSKSKRSVKPDKTKEANLKSFISTPSKSKRSVRPDKTTHAKPASTSNRKSQPQDSKEAKKKKQGYKSPTSVLDDPNQQRKSPKPSTLQRGSDPYFSEGDSSSSSYRFFGKKQPKQDRNALLGLDDASSTSSSLFNTGKRRPTRIFGQEPTRTPKADKTDRNALLGLDDASSTSSSLYGKTGPTRTFGSREDENRHSQLLGYDDFDIDGDAPVGNDDDDDGSSLGLGHNDRRQQANRARGDTGNQQPLLLSPSPSPSDIMMPEHGPRYADRNRPPPQEERQQQLQSFSQIPIHPDMTPEEWQIAQEQIKFLESELDKVSALCQELTEAVDKEEGGGGDEERGGGNANTPADEDWIRAQEQVKYLEQELTTVQELCSLLTSTAKESTDAIEMLEGDKQRLEDLIARLERAMARSKDRIAKRDKALEHLVQENESKCCSWCWDWISEPVVWFVSYLYRIDGGESLRRER